MTQPHTIYLSQAHDPQPTVTVERTVTATPQTVFVTQPSNSPPQANQVVVTVSPQPVPVPAQQPEPQTVTVINGSIQPPSQQQQPQTVTVGPGSTPQSQPGVVLEAGPTTVTVAANPPTKLASVVTITQGLPSSEAPSLPSVITVTQGQPSAPTASIVGISVNSEPPAPGAAQAVNPQTIIISEEPVSSTAQQATVTVAPQIQAVTPSADHYSTLTKTVAGGGGDNIEIFIINIYTGQTSCRKKHSGKPCHSREPQYQPSAASASSYFPCPVVNASTSLATVYNTVLVTLPPGNGTYSTALPAAASQAGMTAMGKMPRAPIEMRKW